MFWPNAIEHYRRSSTSIIILQFILYKRSAFKFRFRDCGSICRWSCFRLPFFNFIVLFACQKKMRQWMRLGRKQFLEKASMCCDHASLEFECCACAKTGSDHFLQFEGRWSQNKSQALFLARKCGSASREWVSNRQIFHDCFDPENT